MIAGYLHYASDMDKDLNDFIKMKCYSRAEPMTALQQLIYEASDGSPELLP